MAFKPINSAGQTVDSAAMEFFSSGAIAIGSVVSFNATNTNYVGVVTNGTNDATISGIFGIARSTGTDGGQVKVLPIVPWTQLYEADTTNVTTTAQIGAKVALTDHATLDNLSGNVDSSMGVFQILAVTGATGDKKVIGRFMLTPFFQSIL